MKKIPSILVAGLLVFSAGAKADQAAIGNLTAAISMCESVISDANSGQYSYPYDTFDTILNNLAAYVTQAQSTASNASTVSTLNPLLNRINKIIANDQAQGGLYANSTVATTLQQMESVVQNALNYEQQAPN